MRAASLTVGWLRGLNSKGVLDDTRYLSVTSGSSWVAMPLISAVADQIKTGTHSVSMNEVAELLKLTLISLICMSQEKRSKRLLNIFCPILPRRCRRHNF